VTDASGQPHLFWFTRTPDELGQFLRDAIDAATRNPQLRAEPAPAPPLVFVEAWNELQEGAYVLPTDEDGYAYGHAIAAALGLPWQTLHHRRFASIRATGNRVTGRLLVDDGWSPCDRQKVRIDAKTHAGWVKAATAMTSPGGSLKIRLRSASGRYRLAAAQTVRYRQACSAAITRFDAQHRRSR
jgi:hypothetical protein